MVLENFELDFYVFFDEELELDDEKGEVFDFNVYIKKICKCDDGSDSEFDGNESVIFEKVYKIVVCKVMKKIKWECLDGLFELDKEFEKGLENEGFLKRDDNFFFEFSD